MMTTLNPSTTIDDMKRQRDDLNSRINAAEAEQERAERLRKARPAAAVLLGRLLLDRKPQPRDARRVREAAPAARQADADAWEVLADHFKFKLPKAVAAVDGTPAVDATPPRKLKPKPAAPAEQVDVAAPSDAGPSADTPSPGKLI